MAAIGTKLYMKGDASPLALALGPVEVLGRLQDAVAMHASCTEPGLCFARFGMGEKGDALVKPHEVAMLLPFEYEPEDV